MNIAQVGAERRHRSLPGIRLPVFIGAPDGDTRAPHRSIPQIVEVIARTAKLALHTTPRYR